MRCLCRETRDWKRKQRGALRGKVKVVQRAFAAESSKQTNESHCFVRQSSGKATDQVIKLKNQNKDDVA